MPVVELVTLLVGPITKLLDKVIPDKDAREKMAHEIATLAADQAHEITLAQIKVNEESARHPSLFVAGARPATIWICNLGLLYAFVVYPVMDIWLDMPLLDVTALLPLLTGLLGLGTMRTVEKVKGVARENLRSSRTNGRSD